MIIEIYSTNSDIINLRNSRGQWASLPTTGDILAPKWINSASANAQFDALVGAVDGNRLEFTLDVDATDPSRYKLVTRVEELSLSAQSLLTELGL